MCNSTHPQTAPTPPLYMPGQHPGQYHLHSSGPTPTAGTNTNYTTNPTIFASPPPSAFAGSENTAFTGANNYYDHPPAGNNNHHYFYSNNSSGYPSAPPALTPTPYPHVHNPPPIVAPGPGSSLPFNNHPAYSAFPGHLPSSTTPGHGWMRNIINNNNNSNNNNSGGWEGPNHARATTPQAFSHHHSSHPMNYNYGNAPRPSPNLPPFPFPSPAPTLPEVILLPAASVNTGSTC